MAYIHQRPEWPKFTWKQEAVALPLSNVRMRQGQLIGRMNALGLTEQDESMLKALTADVVKSSEIEGEKLDDDQVRSSVARRLGLDVAGLVPSDRRTDGVVEMLLEATRNHEQPLTKERLLKWHTSLFAASHEPWIGRWRDDAKGPMQVVSGGVGSERVHFEAPAAERLEAELDAFFSWANGTADIDPLLKAALAHLWLVTIHPFEDGNGRIARAVADWALARSEGSSRRFYSMSAQIQKERKDYYDILEAAQKGGLDATDWVLWFLGCLERAIGGAEEQLAFVLRKDRFWREHAGASLNERQRAMLNRLLDGTFVGKLTSTKWAKLTDCSHDTAQRDIAALTTAGILAKDPGGGRSTSFSLPA
ncbi:MAG: hypothetical protein FD126_356 [Elusimicrobia bacterium]|nr:MAG: hypothetical protein FD126_356 [Elusimicrobiota bacterium]